MATMTPGQHTLHLHETLDEKIKNPKHFTPNVKARLQEKEELSDLNDRLATYIDCVRSLKNQNEKLSEEANQAKDEFNRQAQNIKELYEAELAASRKLLDETSKENASLKLETQKLNAIIVELCPKLEQEQTSNKRMQGKLRGVDRTLKEKENLLALYTTERLDLQKRTKDLEEQLNQLETKLAEDKDQLENEVIRRIDAENRYQTLKEESQFRAKVEGDKLEELRTKLQEEFKQQLEEKDEKNRVLQEMYDNLEAEYEALVDNKNALDEELGEYNKLLYGEEERLKMKTPNSKREGNQSNPRKRLHKETEERPKPCVESSPTKATSVTDVDVSGKFVTITNNGTEDEELGGYFVHRVVDGEDAENDFRFPTNYLLPSKQSVTIWSESRGVPANPPREFVLDGDWLAGGKLVETIIVNTESEVVARYSVTANEQPTGVREKVGKENTSSEYCDVM